MEYIKSQKNGKLLLCDGYRYRKDKARLNSTSWRCTKTGCKGRLLVTGENYKKATNEHNHGPDPASNEAQIVREKIRKSAVSSEERPRAIIQACSSNISEEACIQIQSYDAARRTIQRQRNKILTRNTTRNNNISEIDINEGILWYYLHEMAEQEEDMKSKRIALTAREKHGIVNYCLQRRELTTLT
jgi:hypothetical protein